MLIASSTIIGSKGTGIYLSKDFGETWTNIFISGSGADMTWSSVAISVDGYNMMALQQSLGLYVTTNSGSSWVRYDVDPVLIDPYFTGLSCNAYCSSAIVSISGGAIYYSTNYGRTFARSSVTADTWHSLHANQGFSNLYATSSWLTRSTDGGYSWDRTDLPQRNWMSVAMSTDGWHVIAAAGANKNSNYNTGGLYLSTDGGDTWRLSSASTTLNWYSVASDQTGQYLVAAAYGDGVYFSNDWGKTWYLSDAALHPANWKQITCDNTCQSSFVAITTGSTSGKIYFGDAVQVK